jgi:glycosyltransferase involved in cell wall biosynthesis
MKIGLDCRLLDTNSNTGISRYTSFLIEYYIDRFGDENIFLITNDKNFVYYNCNIIYTKLKPFKIFHFFQFPTFIKDLNLGLLHVPFYSALLLKNSNLKVVVTVHDLMYKLVDEFFGNNQILNKLKIRYFDFIVKKSLLTADVIVSVSETTKNDVFKIFGLRSIHIAEASEIECKEDFSILEKFKLKHKNFYFYCGNNRPHKNIEFIIEIFKTNPDLPPLVLAGKGHRNYENIITTGIVSEEELKALYISAIAFVFPSKYEGFGLPILESLRLKTVVVASKISAFLEFNSPNIFYFSLDSKDEFLHVARVALLHKFNNDDSYLRRYSRDKIYESYDRLINKFYSCK